MGVSQNGCFVLGNSKEIDRNRWFGGATHIRKPPQSLFLPSWMVSQRDAKEHHNLVRSFLHPLPAGWLSRLSPANDPKKMTQQYKGQITVVTFLAIYGPVIRHSYGKSPFLMGQSTIMCVCIYIYMHGHFHLLCRPPFSNGFAISNKNITYNVPEGLSIPALLMPPTPILIIRTFHRESKSCRPTEKKSLYMKPA